MALCAAHRYTLDDFRNIECLGPVHDDVLQTLAKIESLIIVPHEEEPKKPLRRAVAVVPVAAFQPAFQPTIKRSSDFDKPFNDIRAMVNKMSPKNAEKQKPAILDAVAHFLQDGSSRRIADMLTSNTFGVKTNAALYANLCAPEFPCSNEFTTLLQTVLVDEYIASLYQIDDTMPNQEDYDAFCDYNKRNDKRKAMAAFFAETALIGLFHNLRSLAHTLLDFVRNGISEPNISHKVEEWTENLAVLIASDPGLCGLRDGLQDLTQKKPKEFPSWSSRALFKCLDLLTTQ